MAGKMVHMLLRVRDGEILEATLDVTGGYADHYWQDYYEDGENPIQATIRDMLVPRDMVGYLLVQGTREQVYKDGKEAMKALSDSVARPAEKGK